AAGHRGTLLPARLGNSCFSIVRCGARMKCSGRQSPPTHPSKPSARHAMTARDQQRQGAWRHEPDVPAKPTDLVEETRATIDEARVVLPGIQALFGFQFVAIFNTSFQELADQEKYLHLAALLLVAIAVALIMAPAAYHRLAHRG